MCHPWRNTTCTLFSATCRDLFHCPGCVCSLRAYEMRQTSLGHKLSWFVPKTSGSSWTWRPWSTNWELQLMRRCKRRRSLQLSSKILMVQCVFVCMRGWVGVCVCVSACIRTYTCMATYVCIHTSNSYIHVGLLHGTCCGNVCQDLV